MNSFAIVLVASCLCAVLASPPPSYPDRVDTGYPQSIVAKFLNVPTDVDAAFYRPSNGKMYFFKGEEYYRVTDKNFFDGAQIDDAVDAGYPKNILENFGVAGPIDGVFQRPNGKIYFFKGAHYYRVSDKYITGADADTVDSGYPKTIADNFAGVPDNIDAVFQRSTNHIYFFKGDQYYRIADKYTFALDADVVEPCYPKSLARFEGIPASIDAVFQRDSNGKIYFYKGAQYYRVTDKYSLLDFADLADSGYPKLTADFWKQCTGISGLPASPDAAFHRRSNGKIYFFKGNQYWRVSDKNIVDTADDCVDAGYPQMISEKWVGVPDSVDSVFQRTNGKIYFFKGSQYYRVSDKYFFAQDTSVADTVDANYPKDIASNFAGVPDSVDAAFVRNSGHIYFFKGTQYYRVADKYIFDLASDVVESGYPKTIQGKWELPDAPKAIFQRIYNKKIYSFNGNTYTRLTDKNLDVAAPCFPAPQEPCEVCEECEVCEDCEICEVPPTEGHEDAPETVINFNFAGLIPGNN